MRISIITSSRADFGLLKNLILEIKKEKKFLIFLNFLKKKIFEKI